MHTCGSLREINIERNAVKRIVGKRRHGHAALNHGRVHARVIGSIQQHVAHKLAVSHDEFHILVVFDLYANIEVAIGWRINDSRGQKRDVEEIDRVHREAALIGKGTGHARHVHGGNAALTNGVGPQRQGALAAVECIGHLGHIARSVHIGQARLQIGPAYKASTLLGARLDGELARRAHADRDDNHIARLVGTIGQAHMRHALAFTEHLVDRHAGVAENAMRLHKARNNRGTVRIEHGGQNARAAIEHVDTVGMVAQRLGRLHAN